MFFQLCSLCSHWMIWLSGLPSSRCVLQSLVISLANCRVDRQDEVKAILSICTIYTSSPNLVLREALLFHDLFVGYLRSKKPPQLIGVHFDCMSLATWVCGKKENLYFNLAQEPLCHCFHKARNWAAEFTPVILRRTSSESDDLFDNVK